MKSYAEKKNEFIEKLNANDIESEIVQGSRSRWIASIKMMRPWREKRLLFAHTTMTSYILSHSTYANSLLKTADFLKVALRFMHTTYSTLVTTPKKHYRTIARLYIGTARGKCISPITYLTFRPCLTTFSTC